MRLLCDEMLKGLARWLRAAGHDTELAADGEADRKLITRARNDERLLLSRDRKLLEHRDGDQVVCLLECNSVDSCARELTIKTGIDWLYKPFSRCLVCNTPLEDLPSGDYREIPDDVKNSPLLYCPSCQRIYWEGGHVQRMRQRLEEWAKIPAAPDYAD